MPTTQTIPQTTTQTSTTTDAPHPLTVFHWPDPRRTDRVMLCGEDHRLLAVATLQGLVTCKACLARMSAQPSGCDFGARYFNPECTQHRRPCP